MSFEALSSDKRQETDRYWGPQDPNYKEVLAQIQRLLLFKASAAEKLEGLLEELIDAQFPINISDNNGRTSLHVAASVPNYTAVTILINKGGARVIGKDKFGRTPLHAVIRRAIELDPVEDWEQKPFKDVIQRILRKTLKVDELDLDKRSAWDYASEERFKWIKELKAHRDLIQGPTISAISKPLEALQLPTDLAVDVVKTFEGVLAEFFLEKKDGGRHEFINYETPTLWDMIYDARKGPERILGVSRPKGFKGRARCRWIHIPTNCEQWMHDLFIRLRIKDSSLAGERHVGGTPVGRYMFPQAKRYKHVSGL